MSQTRAITRRSVSTPNFCDSICRNVAKHTKVLNVLIGEEAHNTTGHGVAGLRASSLSLVDDDSVGESGSDKGCSVRELGHSTVVVHAQPGEAVTNRGEDQGEVPVRGCCVSLMIPSSSCSIVGRGKASLAVEDGRGRGLGMV